MTGRDWITEPPQENRRARRRRERAQDAAERRQEVRARTAEASAQITVPGALVGVVVVLVVMGLLAFLPQLMHRTPAAAPSGAESMPVSEPVASVTTSPSPTGSTSTSAGSSSTPAPTRALSGDELATSWLRAYLTRPTPADTSWTAAVAGISDPALVEQLRSAGPTKLGLPTWGPWQVTDLRPITLPDQGVNTPTRTVSSWVATISDGAGRSETRGFTVIAFQSSGGWRVAQVTHLYSSGG